VSFQIWPTNNRFITTTVVYVMKCNQFSVIYEPFERPVSKPTSTCATNVHTLYWCLQLYYLNKEIASLNITVFVIEFLFVFCEEET
jgi:hypothetical protein